MQRLFCDTYINLLIRTEKYSVIDLSCAILATHSIIVEGHQMSQDGKRYIVFIMSLVINGLEFEKNREGKQTINI